jgi:hypothetical protein
MRWQVQGYRSDYLVAVGEKLHVRGTMLAVDVSGSLLGSQARRSFPTVKVSRKKRQNLRSA